MTFKTIENSVGKKAKLEFVPLQKGEICDTHASVDQLVQALDYKPSMGLEEGINKFVCWYRNYYKC